MNLPDHELVTLEFLKRYSAFECPFQSVDEWEKKANLADRRAYYLKAKDLVDHEVYKREILDMKRSFFTKLALQANTDLERQGYRMTLIALDMLEKRFETLASKHSATPLSDSLDKI